MIFVKISSFDPCFGKIPIRISTFLFFFFQLFLINFELFLHFCHFWSFSGGKECQIWNLIWKSTFQVIVLVIFTAWTKCLKKRTLSWHQIVINRPTCNTHSPATKIEWNKISRSFFFQVQIAYIKCAFPRKDKAMHFHSNSVR